ncbi:MAG: immunoglobulin domain-containing protein, partial [Phycisphaerae bacterium]
ASFSITASGATTFQWRRGTTNLVDGGNVSGATTATLTINPAGPGDVATDYNCVASNACGNVTSSTAELTVNGAPTITQEPLSTTAGSGCIAQFTVVATGTPPLTYQWTRDTLPLADGGNISGATTDTLTIDPVGAADAATYRVVVGHPCGDVTSAAATLSVCVGDLNGDSQVNLTDLSRLLSLFGATEGVECNEGDLDGDGDVDLSDLSKLLARFGASCP